jgi:hypothetical protein
MVEALTPEPSGPICPVKTINNAFAMLQASAVAEQKFAHLWYEIKSGCQL